MIASFTGTQEGMTDKQITVVEWYLEQLGPVEFHHGDCIGADAEAHHVAVQLSIPVYIHPPTAFLKRAFCHGTWVKHIFSPKPYLERNKDMAQVCDILIATPKEMQEVVRSGTWATIRYAKKLGREVIIILPNGQEV